MKSSALERQQSDLEAITTHERKCQDACLPCMHQIKLILRLESMNPI